jgi:N6-adenosine-specific RNA methylase IME4
MSDYEVTMVPLGSIKVPPGRRAVRDEAVSNLMVSIAEIGLLQPITLTTDFTMVTGLHRFTAFKRLEKESIPAYLRDLDSLNAELAEIDENLSREDLSPAERAKLTARRKAIYLAKHPETGHGMAPAARGSDKGGKAPVGKNDNLSSLPFTEDTAKKAGKNRRTVERDANRGEKVSTDVLEAVAGTDLDTGVNLDALSKLAPARQKAVVEHAKTTGVSNLKVAARNLKRQETKQAIEAEPQPLPTGPFRVIVADPPWLYYLRDDDETHRGTVDYERMTTEDICNLDVAARAHEDCILFLWTTNAHMHDAFHVVEAWGFEQKTILTWAKDRIGAGHWLRGQTEHCILAVKGKPTVMLTNQSTLLHGEVREHSRKPDEFYKLVEGLCPGAKLEMFARQEREGWTTWGAERDKFEDTDKSGSSSTN